MYCPCICFSVCVLSVYSDRPSNNHALKGVYTFKTRPCIVRVTVSSSVYCPYIPTVRPIITPLKAFIRLKRGRVLSVYLLSVYLLFVHTVCVLCVIQSVHSDLPSNDNTLYGVYMLKRGHVLSQYCPCSAHCSVRICRPTVK